MAETPNLLTYQDAVDHLRMKEESSRENMLLRSAVQHCYEIDLPSKSPAGRWLHYLTEHDLRYNATVTTGTITYDHTGGASERLLTFSDALTGDPLTNLIYYRIRINSLNYDISTLLSSTTCQLSVKNNPGADIAAGTYTLYRNRYVLPPDFVSMYPPLNSSIWRNRYISPQDFQYRERHLWNTNSQPNRFTILSSDNVMGQMEMGFDDVPSADGAVRFLYYRLPRKLKYHGYEEDIRGTTLTGTAGVNTVTLSSDTIANADWVGRFIRMYDTTNWPTGRTGIYQYKEQQVITNVSGATITLAANLANTFAAGTKYVVTDPLDLRPTMNLALLRGIEWQLQILQNRDDGPAFQRYMEAVRSAGESDDVMEGIRPRLDMYRSAGLTHSPVVTS